MIEPNPAQRFSSYDEVVSRLEEAQHALKSLDNVDVVRSRWWRWLSRRRNR